MGTKGIRPLVAGNWKMNASRAQAALLIEELLALARHADLGAELLVCPPFPYLAPVWTQLTGSGIGLGGQDCHIADSGAHTGDIAAAMLKDVGCSHVILGHSERRADHAESSQLVAAKAKAAIRAGLDPIICVGETEVQRNKGETLEIIENQIVDSIPSSMKAANIVVAYEPVWAIGSGRTPTIDEVAAVHRHIRGLLGRRVPGGAKIRILYGGSVKPRNAKELMAVPDVNGALVGGASLKAADFWAIAQAVV